MLPITFKWQVIISKITKWRSRSSKMKIFPTVGPFVIVLKEGESEVAQSCLTLCDSMDCSPPGFSTHGVFQARIMEGVAISFSRGSSPPRDRTQVSCIEGRRFTLWATREVLKIRRSIRGLWKLPDGIDWLRGILGLILMGRAELSRCS